MKLEQGRNVQSTENHINMPMLNITGTDDMGIYVIIGGYNQ